MILKSIKYHLVHLVAGAEHNTPLLASQVFDRAEVEAIASGENKPISVSVWVEIPFRLLFNKKNIEVIKSLKIRCPNIKIKLIPRISRLNNFPLLPLFILQRLILNTTTVYHCRGESSFDWAILLKKYFPNDKFILDIRGFQPFEYFLKKNIFFENMMNSAEKDEYLLSIKKLKERVSNADIVCTVSEGLKQMLIDKVNAKANTVIIPCCVKNVVSDESRNKIRKQLNIENNIAILYLGGLQVYQSIEDLVIPYIKSSFNLSDKTIGVFLTQDKSKIEILLKKYQVDHNRIRIVSVSQGEVSDYLTGMDFGLFFPAKSELSSTYQPVKLGEYFSAGLPVIVNSGTEHLSDLLNKYNIGYTFKLSNKYNNEEFDNEVKNSLDWYYSALPQIRERAKTFVKNSYTWESYIKTERDMYINVLNKIN